jgi:exosortase
MSFFEKTYRIIKTETYIRLFIAVLPTIFIALDFSNYLIKQCIREGSNWKLFIFLIGGYLIWLQRTAIQKPWKQSPLIGIPLITIGCAGYFIWKIFLIDISVEISIVFLILGVIIQLFGLKISYVALLPVFYFFIMTSIIERLMNFLAIYLQHASAVITALFLNSAGWTVLRDGIYLRLPHTVLKVAQACSGTAQLTALIAISIPFALLLQRKWWATCILVLSTLPITILSNSIRIIFIAIWNYQFSQAYVHGPNDIFRMPLIYPFSLILLFLISRVLNYFEMKQPLTHKYIAPTPISGVGKKTVPFYILFTVFTLPCITMAAIPILQPKPKKISRYLSTPEIFDGWVAENYTDSLSPVFWGSPDIVIHKKYKNSSHQSEIRVSIAYCAAQNTSKKITSPNSILMFGAKRYTTLGIEGGQNLNILEITPDLQEMDVTTLLWYGIDGSTYNSVKLFRNDVFHNTIFKRKNNAAFVSISAVSKCGVSTFESRNQEIKKFAKVLAPLIIQSLRTD